MNKKSSELNKFDIRIPERSDIRNLSEGSSMIRNFKYCSLKLDGYWVAVKTTGHGSVSVWTRGKKNITAAVSHNMWYNSLQLYCPKSLWIFGELWKGNIPCSSLSTELANGGSLDFRCFDAEGYTSFEALDEFCESVYLSRVPRLYHGLEGYNWIRCKAFLDRCSVAYSPNDGLVFSDGPGINLHRYKPDKTIDLIYEGFDHGKKGSKNRFTVGALRLRSAEGYPIAKATGISDTERAYILQHNDRLKGKVVTVKYKGVTSKGKLRHCTFLRFRDDKEPDECLVFQDKDLECHYQTKNSSGR